MYPYAKKWRWFAKHPQKHFLDALDDLDGLRPGADQVMRHRIALHGRWMLIRTILLVPLSVGAVSSAAGFLIEALGGFAAAQDALDVFQRISTTFATVFAILFILAGRTADQAFHDILGMLHGRSEIPPKAK